MVGSDILKTVNEPWKLPEGWKWKKLSEVAETKIGSTPNRKKPEYFQVDIPWIKSGELKDNHIFDSDEKINDEALKKTNLKIFPKGTLLIARYGANVGRLGILELDSATNQAICAIFPNSSLDKFFLFYYLKTIRQLLIDKSFGTVIRNLNQDLIKRITIPIPVPDEPTRSLVIQRSTVARIKALLAEVEQAQVLLKQMRKDTEQMMNAALSEAIALISDLKLEPLTQYSLHLNRGASDLKKYASPDNDGPLFIRSSNVGFAHIELAKVERLDLPHNLGGERALVTQGDVLVPMTGTIGRCCVVSERLERAYIDQNIALIRLKESLEPRYLMWFIVYTLSRMASTTNMQHGQTIDKLSLNDLRKLHLPIPKKSEQRQIVSYLDAIKAEVDMMRQYLDEKNNLINQMEQSILEKAFRGDL